MLAVAGDTESALTLDLVDLPSLGAVAQVPLPDGFGGFVAAPNGGVFIFPRWGRADIQLLSQDFSQATPLLQLDGSVLRLIPGPSR